MQNSERIKSYTRIAAQTAPPGVLIQMLFDRAVRALEEALAGFEFSNPRERNETIHNNLRRAIDIIRLLKNSLNLVEGGELAQTLRNLYTYFEEHLVQSNMTKTRDGVDEVLRHLRPLRDTWGEMLSKQGQEEPMEQVKELAVA